MTARIGSWPDVDDVIEHRIRDTGDGIEVRPPLVDYLISLLGVLLGGGFIANGLWGRNGEPGQVAFGLLFLVTGIATGIAASVPLVSADATGLRVGTFRRVRVPWTDLVALRMRDASAMGWRSPVLRVVRREGRPLPLRPMWNVRSYRTMSDLRQVGRRLAVAGEQSRGEPVPWPENVQFRGRDGTLHPVR